MARAKRFAPWTSTLLAVCLYWALTAQSQNSAPTNQTPAATPADVDSLIRDLKDPDYKVRLNAARVLQKLSDPKVIAALIDALSDKEGLGNGGVQTGWDMAQALTSIGEPAVDALTSEMNNPNAESRRMAALALSEIPGLHAEQGLRKAFDDPDTNVRSTACAGIGDGSRLDSDDLRNRVSLLVSVIEHDPEDSVALDAADALAKVRSQYALQALTAALPPWISGARWRVAMALGRSHNSEAITPLLKTLTDVDTQVRRAAATALGELAGDVRLKQDGLAGFVSLKAVNLSSPRCTIPMRRCAQTLRPHWERCRMIAPSNP